ncbi:MAG: hypothetical protein IIA33_10675 [Planctomycetes bacterium]|nr:hypothetical protein [Planctomycetota bacterium]
MHTHSQPPPPARLAALRLAASRLAAPRVPTFQLLICLTWSALAGGCSDSICPDRPPDEFQLSPTGRAVAYVDREIFANVLNWMEAPTTDDPAISFDCLIDYFTARFTSDVDIIFVVMNQSRGEFLEQSARKVIANFTASQRFFESGIGSFRRPPISNVGPPRMRSYSFLGVRDGLLAGPSLHEIAHGWSAYLDGPLSLAEQTDRDPISHWGFTSVGGVLGGWDASSLEALGDEQYRVCSPSPHEAFAPQGYAHNSVHYAPLELYLMGLLDPEDVPDIQVAIDPVLTTIEGTCVTFQATALETVSVAEIIAANGVRLPSSEDSPKHFDIALIVIAQQSLTEAEWQVYEDAMVCMEATSDCGNLATGIAHDGREVVFQPLTFFEATAGRASLRFAVLQQTVDTDQATTTRNNFMR